MLRVVHLNNRMHGDEKELKRILGAMDKIDRRYFVLDQYQSEAYEDIPLPIGRGQTISQPTTVARMLLMAKIKKGMNILEVGSGSGWNAGLSAYLAYPGKVISVERIPELSEFSKENINKLKKEMKAELNVEFMGGSIFSFNELTRQRFDLVIVTAAGEKSLVDRLKKFNFSKLIVPTKEGALEIWRKKGKKIELEHREMGYAFVPLMR